jgi:UDP-N-acetylglucosamine 4,6-dehydratase
MRVLILGGTGTLGTELTRRWLLEGCEVTVFSRDELKQKQMAARMGGPLLRFRLGDIRDRAALARAMVGMDIVFHVAALKHVDTLEEHPEESVATNIQGTINVADCAEAAGVGRVVFSSTDKAVSPINVYGMSKGISERILLQRNKAQSSTTYAVYRWGNVLGSRGSVLDTFKRTIQCEGKAYLTHPEMTRFWIRIEDAVDYMLKTYVAASRTDAMIPPIKAASVANLALSVARYLGYGEHVKLEVTRIRPGEKLHESLTETLHSDEGPRYTPAELDELVTPLLGVEA